jgi:hypothetical protein
MDDYFERLIKVIRELDDAHEIAETLQIADNDCELQYDGDIEDFVNSMSDALEEELSRRND